MALSQSLKNRTLLSRLKSFIEVERFRGSCLEDGGRTQFSSNAGECSSSGQIEFSKWRKLDSRNLGITMSMITVPSRIILRKLRDSGFDAYLVGGCVRDLLLNKIPKDYDIITTATLKQVKRSFQRAIIVGQRFPICLVTVKDYQVEVSSFDTVAEKSKRKQVGSSHMATRCDPKDFLRWKNCMTRDFTVNSLFFDPFLNLIFDYTNGMMDLKSLKLRTVKPAHSSFLEDQARILRGLRLAARLNLSFSKEAESAIYSLSSLVANLSTSRISLEMNYMLSYGAAEPSLLLLKSVLIVVEQTVFLFNSQDIVGSIPQIDNRLGVRSSMLMKLFFNLDQLITCDQPCSQSMWVAIMAFHIALFSNPQHAVVVLTFASLLHHQTLDESIKFARKSVLATHIYVPEILDAFHYISDNEVAERVAQFARQVENSVNVLIFKDCLLEAMARFPENSCSGLFFVSQKMGRVIKQIFNIMEKDATPLKKADKRITNINYQLLTAGNIGQVRFVLGKIILDTLVYGPVAAERPATEAPKDDNLNVARNPPHKILNDDGHMKKVGVSSLSRLF